MIRNIVELLKIHDHKNVSEEVEIAKGKYKINSSIKDIYKQRKRSYKWQRNSQ